jgi:signal peptidase complex subunit 3
VSNGSAMLSSFLMTLLAAITLSTFLFTADPKGQLVIGSLKMYVH